MKTIFEEDAIMKMIEMLLSALLKKGILAEFHNVETDLDIPDSKMTVKVKIDHMTVSFTKKDEEE